jgi:GT2 family glycosyltransferase
VSASTLAIVVIGRNEGKRLHRCLRSVLSQGYPVFYVDSGSTDGSADVAHAAGAEVISLASDRPFTAARGRNVGFRRALECDSALAYVQFVDGDCELELGWLEAARAYLEAHIDVAVVCGRRREIHPRASIFNRLIDMEWAGIPGEVAACGGDALIRVDALAEVGGYDETLIAGEDPELCLRIRRCGWRIARLPNPMTLHDAAITELRQWLKRSMRAGHAYAERFSRHRDHDASRRIASAVLWAGALPALVLVISPFHPSALLVLLVAYGILWLRIVFHRAHLTPGFADRTLYASACILGKFPELYGAARFAFGNLSRRPRRLIEYKGPGATS